MSCNRHAEIAEAFASTAGAGHITAAWAETRQYAGQVCPVCRNCFLRQDGGCTKCESALADKAQDSPEMYEAGYRDQLYPERVMADLSPVMAGSQDEQVRQVAAGRLTDPQVLSDLGLNDPGPAVKAAVAGNSHTPRATLAGLLRSQDRSIYRAAALNPALPVSALEQQAREAAAAWQKLAARAIQPVIYQMTFSLGRGGRGSGFGSLLLPAIIVGTYGATGYRSWRRHRDLSLALRERQREGGSQGTPAQQPAQPDDNGRTAPAIPSARPPVRTAPAARLTGPEMSALDEELKLAESALEMTEDYYDGAFTMEEVVRIQNDGVVTDHDAEIAGHLLEQAEETARRFPGWHDGHGPDDFKQIQGKLRCPRCGLYAGVAGQHQCHYSPRLAALRQPEAGPEVDEMSPLEMYSEIENA